MEADLIPDYSTQDYFYTENSTLPANFDYDDTSYFEPILLTVIGVIGVLTNGILLFVLRKSRVRNTPHAFIVNMSVANLLFIFVYLPVAAVDAHTPFWYPFPVFVCKLAESVYEVSTSVTAFSLVALSVHSYLDGRGTATTLRHGCTKWNTVVAVAVTWTPAVALALPTMMFAHVPGVDGDFSDTYCQPYKLEYQAVEVPVRIAVNYLIPLGAVGFLCCVGSLFGATSAPRSASQKEFAHLTIVLAAVYAVCFLPTHVFTLCIVFFVDELSLFWRVIGVVADWLPFAYRCLNLVAVFCTSSDFRHLFYRHLCLGTKNQEPPRNQVPLNRNRDLAPRSRTPVSDYVWNRERQLRGALSQETVHIGDTWNREPGQDVACGREPAREVEVPLRPGEQDTSC